MIQSPLNRSTKNVFRFYFSKHTNARRWTTLRPVAIDCTNWYRFWPQAFNRAYWLLSNVITAVRARMVEGGKNLPFYFIFDGGPSNDLIVIGLIVNRFHRIEADEINFARSFARAFRCWCECRRRIIRIGCGRCNGYRWCCDNHRWWRIRSTQCRHCYRRRWNR